MFGLDRIRFDIAGLREDVKRLAGFGSYRSKEIETLKGQVGVQAKEIADLKAVVQELRESHNDLFKYDVSKRFMVSGLYTGRVMFFDMARSLFGQPSSHKPEPDATPYVARLAKTDPQAEPIPVKPARKR